MELLVILVLVVLIGGPICAVVALVKANRLQRELTALRERVHDLEWAPEPEAARQEQPEAVAPAAESPADVIPVKPDVVTEPPAVSAAAKVDTAEELPGPEQDAADEAPAPEPSMPRKPQPAQSPVDAFVELLTRNWMIWLGGVCVTLAGVFLVHYSIERGLLGPVARIVAGLLFGTGLHVSAEWLRRRTGGTHPTFSVLAGAGSITLYASVFAALRLYDLVEPGPAFLAMAVIAFGTIAMAFVHGPVLAAFGILGAYLVPVLVSSDSGNMIVALIYVLIVSASALTLLRYIYRRWLWMGVLVGTLAWWLLSLGSSDADYFRVVYLAVFAYALYAIPDFDWRLSVRHALGEGGFSWRTLRTIEEPARFLPLIMLTIAGLSSLSILKVGDFTAPWTLGLPFTVLSLWLARQREELCWLPWLNLLVQSAAWVLAAGEWRDPGFEIELLGDAERSTFLLYLVINALLTSGLSFFSRSDGRYNAWPTSLLALAPVVSIALAYLLTGYPEPNSWWSIVTATAAAAYLALATAGSRRSSDDALVVWLFIAGHAALSLAAALFFREATLTLAFAVQIVSMAWVIHSFRLPGLGWVLKLIVLAVIARLTFNPWITEYATGTHWTLWTYGGSTVCAIIGWRLLRSYGDIARWAEGAALHLFVLTAWTELRYQLYDGDVYGAEPTALEATLSMLLFSALSLVYHRRALVSETLGWLYRLFSTLLLLASASCYVILVGHLVLGDSWLHASVSATPVFNLLLPAFGLPIAIGLLVYRYHRLAFRSVALAVAGFATFVFASIQVRHLATGSADLYGPPVQSGELYTYSAVWLVLAVATMLAGSWRYGQTVYRAGLALLALVIGKLFLVDMSDLEGLLRVASFLGLGLSLLGLSYLHQKLRASTD